VTIEEVFKQTDWALLREQKTALEEEAGKNDLLTGLLSFLDAVQECRFGRRIPGVRRGGATTVRMIRVTVEQAAGRARLRAVDGAGRAVVVVENLPPGDACRERNRLVERLVAEGEYDEVTGDAIGPFAAESAEPAPWVRRPGDKDRS
jgi:hypothetical protein